MMTGAGIVPFTLLCNMLSNKNYFKSFFMFAQELCILFVTFACFFKQAFYFIV